MINLVRNAAVAFLLGLSLAGTCAAAPAFAGSAAVRNDTLAAKEPAMRSGFDEPKPATIADYRLGTGDKVRVTVYGEDDLSGVFQVDAKGFVQLPLVGAIQAAGGTAADLEVRLETALSDGFVLSPRVNIEVTQYRPFYVIGEVAKPGQYDYVNEMSVPNAIALAGGYTVKAVNSWVYIRHAHETAERRVPADETTKIEPGDVLRIPDTAFWSVMEILSPITSMGAGSLPRPY